MKFRSRRILTKNTAPLVWRAGRMARLGAEAKPDTQVERFFHAGHKLMAAPVPKVASRTFKAMFREMSGGGEFEVALNPEEIRAEFPDYFIFSFTRNPWSRAYSCWRDKVADAVTPGKISILSRYPGLKPFMPFEEFVEWLNSPDGGDNVADRHWMSQVRHLDAGGEPLCDFVGRLEELDVGMLEVSRRTGLDLPDLGWANATQKRDRYKSAYDPRTRALIAERYREDIETFRYRFRD